MRRVEANAPYHARTAYALALIRRGINLHDDPIPKKNRGGLTTAIDNKMFF